MTPLSIPQDFTLDNGFSFCEIFINLLVVVVKGFYIREYFFAAYVCALDT